MARLDNLKTIPVGSLLTLPQQESDPYFNEIAAMPVKLKTLMTSVNTGAFTRGLAKSYGLPEDKSSIIALGVLRVAVGEKKLEDLSSLLAAEVPLPLNTARKMAAEIEKDLFEPVGDELEQYWQEKKETRVPLKTDNVSNVLDLKKEKKVPPPPPMPGNQQNI